MLFSSCGDITLFDITQGIPNSLEEYDVIGFASGIYFQKFKNTVLECAKEKLSKGKKVFLIYTYGAKRRPNEDDIAGAVEFYKEKCMG